MSAPQAVPPFPTTPDEVPAGIGLVALVQALSDHRTEVLLARPRVGEDAAAADGVFAHATAALALQQTLLDRLQAGRWSLVRDALAADVERAADVAAACGLDGDEVAAGLRRWADGQLDHGLMTGQEAGLVELMARTIGDAR